MQSLCLGRLPTKQNAKTLKFASYLSDEQLPAPASKVFREYKVPEEAKKMFGNDSIGDCTCAAIANLIILTSCHTGDCIIPTEQAVIDLYSAVTGYDGSPATDNGAAMTDVLDYMMKVGISIGSSKLQILGWAAINHDNLQHRQLACQLFGASYVGVNLPASALMQFRSNLPWEVVNSNVEGGHAIIRPGYGRLGDDYVTWARWDQKASAEWSKQYVEEEYAVILPTWLEDATHATPAGLNLDALLADLKLLGAE